MKTLSNLAIAELGITELFAGRTYAYVAVMHGHTYGLGIAEANSAGYSPIPLLYAQADTFDLAHDMADALNRDVLGINLEAAARIVCSSMAAGKIRKTS